MTLRRCVMCGLAMGLVLWGAGIGAGLLPGQSDARAQDPPFVPSTCALEGAWIMAVSTPQGQQIQTLTLTAQTERPDLYTAVMESSGDCPTLMSAMPGCDRQSRFVGLAKTGATQDWQLTVLNYSLTQNRNGSQSPLVTVISSDTLHCIGPDVMEAEVSIATYLPHQDADHIGLPALDDKPIACTVLDAMFRRVSLMPPCEEIPVTEPIAVQVGDEFTVSLESNPTTGYAWAQVGGFPDWLEQTDYQYKPSSHEPGMVGSGGFDEWTYRAKAAGLTTLLYVYRQPWATEGPPEKTHSVQVISQEPMNGQ